MATASITRLAGGISDQLDGMVKRANLVPGYLNRVVYREYQNAQRERWKSENNGADFAGEQWAALDPAYAAWKKKNLKGYPGNGGKINIATGRLFQAVIGPSADHRKMVDSKSIRINYSVEYGRYVDEKRTFTQWSDQFYNRLYRGIVEYLTRNIIRGGA